MTTANFVDFQNVWLAYNDELLAQNHFAVEDINLQVKQGEFIAIVEAERAVRRKIKAAGAIGSRTTQEKNE